VEVTVGVLYVQLVTVTVWAKLVRVVVTVHVVVDAGGCAPTVVVVVTVTVIGSMAHEVVAIAVVVVAWEIWVVNVKVAVTVATAVFEGIIAPPDAPGLMVGMLSCDETVVEQQTFDDDAWLANNNPAIPAAATTATTTTIAVARMAFTKSLGCSTAFTPPRRRRPSDGSRIGRHLHPRRHS